MLKKLSGFSQFIKINSVDDQSIYKAANNLKLVFVKKNDYLFHEGDESKHFFGIISGKISMRKNIPISSSNRIKGKEDADERERIADKTRREVKTLFNNSQKADMIEEVDKQEYYEEELFTRGEGYCFGEWGLIFKSRRATSVYTLEDTYFFSLDEENFKSSFMQCLNKAEFERREFLSSNFFPFKSISFEVILDLYKSTIPIYCNANQVIYNEGEDAKALFIVYLDSFSLEKKYFEPVRKKYEIFKIVNIEKGGVVGLESIFRSNGKYTHTLRANCSGGIGIIFSLQTSKLTQLVKRRMMAYFKNYYETLTKTANSFFEKKIELKKKTIHKKKIDTLTDCEKCQNAINNFFDNEKNTKKRTAFSRDKAQKVIYKPSSALKRKGKFVSNFSSCNTLYYLEDNSSDVYKKESLNNIQSRLSAINKINQIGSSQENFRRQRLLKSSKESLLPRIVKSSNLSLYKETIQDTKSIKRTKDVKTYTKEIKVSNQLKLLKKSGKLNKNPSMTNVRVPPTIQEIVKGAKMKRRKLRTRNISFDSGMFNIPLVSDLLLHQKLSSY